MEHINPVVRSIMADLFINLAAGWVGVLIIVPNFTKEKRWRQKVIVLTGDLLGVTLQ